MVDRQKKLHSLLPCFFRQLCRKRHLTVLAERFARIHTLGFQKGVSHASSYKQRVHLVNKIFNHAYFVRNFGSAEYGDKGVFGIFERSAEKFKLLFHEKTADRILDKCRNSRSRGMGAVRRAESVVYVYVRKRSKTLAKSGFVGFLLFFKTQVFHEQHVTVLHLRNFPLGVLSRDVSRKNHLSPEKLLQSHGNRRKRKFFPELSLGASEMRTEYDLSSVFRQIFDCGQGGGDSCVVAHLSVFVQRYVEIYTHETSFAF